MLYPPEILVSMKKVEATRQARVGQAYPRLAQDERQAILRTFHPDYVENAFRPLRIGPNKGNRTLHELAAVLEARPRVRRGSVDLSSPLAECDVLVIGGGGAGASAALLAHEAGACVILVTKLRFGDANTMMAQGGIQAADKPDDSPAHHYLDVIGTMRTIHGGGTSRKRMHAARDYSGAEIMRTLRDEVRSRADITVTEFSPALELVLDENGRVAGAVVQNLETQATGYIRAKATIIATGGSGRLHYQGFPTTNHYGATGDGLVLAYRVGAPLAFIDTMQYHPTGAAFPEQILGQLVTEKVRGLGAQVCDAEGEQFVFPLETRDVEAAAFIRECKERGRGLITPAGQPCVWLDSPLIDVLHGPGTIAHALPAMVRQYKRFGIDMTKEPILVYPTLHYQNGGVAIKPDASTPVPGLYVAGEASGGVHGRNRLMGNSLLDIVVFGRRAGRAAGAYAGGVQLGAATLAHLDVWNRELDQAGLEAGLPGHTSPVLLPDYTRHVGQPETTLTV
jgi:succinate dehydrogenase/fumarate reductase flavoprotein subunit